MSGLHEPLSLPALLHKHILFFFFFASKYLIRVRYVVIFLSEHVLESDPAPCKTLGQTEGRDLSAWQMLSEARARDWAQVGIGPRMQVSNT